MCSDKDWPDAHVYSNKIYSFNKLPVIVTIWIWCFKLSAILDNVEMWKKPLAGCLNSTHTIIVRQGGRKEAEGKKRCRLSQGFLGCSVAFDLCVWLIALDINHRYGPGASHHLEVCEKTRQKLGERVHNEGEEQGDSCVFESLSW